MPDIDNRSAFEAQLESVLTQAFASARNLMFLALWYAGLTSDELASIPTDVVEQIQVLLAGGITPVLAEVYEASAHELADALSYGMDEEALQNNALLWATPYAMALSGGLVRTSVNSLQSIAGSRLGQPMTRQQLSDVLLRVWSPARVETIAITEVTNAVSEGENVVMDTLRAEGTTVVAIWITQRDERVCPVCAPRHGRERGDGWQNNPPAHPRCRCYLGYTVTNGDTSFSLIEENPGG